MRLYLVRHGQTEWNGELRYQGHTDCELSDLGRAQSQVTAELLSGMSCDGCSLYSSDLSRARATASPVAEKLGIAPTYEFDLREASFGEWEGLSFDEIAKRFPQAWEQWREDPIKAEIKDAEPRADFRDRVLGKIDSIIRHHTKGAYGYLSTEDSEDDGAMMIKDVPEAIIVTHGGVVKTVLAHSLGLSFDGYWKIRADNGGVSVVDVYPAGSIISHLNITHHLEALGGGDRGDRVL